VPASAEAAPAAQTPATSEQVSTIPAPVAVQPAAKPVAPRRVAPAPRAAPVARAAPAVSAPSPAAAGPAARPAAESAAPPAPRVAAVTPAPAAGEQEARRIAELRARSDDQAAALLALDDRLALLQKQAELLKAQLEQVLAAPASQSSAAAATAPPASVSTSAAPESKPAAAVAQPKPVATAPVAAAPVRKDEGILDLVTDWRVAAGGLTALLLGAIVLKLRRRPSERAPEKFAPSATATWPKGMPSQAPAPAESAYDKTQEFRAAPIPRAGEATVEWKAVPQAGRLVDQTAEWVPPPTTDTLPLPESVPAPAAAKPQLPGAGISREFHITQQFQPVAERVVALSSPEEIVLQARTHYMDDGDVFRAIDLLEMAVAARKDSTRPWQALFAIYRRENMPERFQRLVLAYRSAFGQDESWPAIRSLGHAIDANNPLYGGEAPAEPIPDDLVERWLGVPLDFTAHLLANEMHDQLMETFPGRSKKRKRTVGE
jgi:hypothetical protein